MLTLFYPAIGQVGVKDISQATNAILHTQLKEQIKAVLKTLPDKPKLDE
jgi:hypothetical protein